MSVPRKKHAYSIIIVYEFINFQSSFSFRDNLYKVPLHRHVKDLPILSFWTVSDSHSHLSFLIYGQLSEGGVHFRAVSHICTIGDNFSTFGDARQ